MKIRLLLIVSLISYSLIAKANLNTPLNLDSLGHFGQLINKVEESLLIPDSSNSIYNTLNSIQITEQSSSYESLLYNYYWGLYYYMSNYNTDQSIHYLQKSREIANKLNYTYYQYSTNKLIGLLFEDDYSKSYAYFDEAQKYCLKLNSKVELLDLLLTYLYKDVNSKLSDSIASKRLYEAENIIKETPDLLPLYKIRYYVLKGQYDKELDVSTSAFNNAISVANESGFSYIVNDINSMKANAFIFHEEYDSALVYLSPDSIYSSLTFVQQQSIVNKAYLFHDSGDYERALKYFNLVYKPDLEFHGGAYGKLNDLGYSIYLGLQDSSKALHFLQLKQDFIIKKNKLAIDSFQVAYNYNADLYTDKIELIKEKSRIQSERLIISIICLVMFIITLVIYHFYYKKNEKLVNNYNQLKNEALYKDDIHKSKMDNLKLLGLQIKHPIYNSQLLIENLLYNFNKHSEFSDILVLLKTNHDKLINKLNLITAPPVNNNYKKYYSQQPKWQFGFSFINLLVDQIHILFSPKSIVVQLEHCFTKKSTYKFDDIKIEYLIFELFEYLVLKLENYNAVSIKIDAHGENTLNIIIQINKSNIDSFEPEKIENITKSGNQYTNIKYDTSEDSSHFTIQIETKGVFKDNNTTLNHIDIKPININKPLLKDKSLLLLSSNHLVRNIIQNINNQVDIISTQDLYMNPDFLKNNADLYIYFTDEEPDQCVYILDILSKSEHTSPLLIIDYYQNLTHEQKLMFNGPNTLIIDTLNVNTIINSLVQLSDKQHVDYSHFIEHNNDSEILLDKIISGIIANISNPEYKLKDLASDVNYSERHLQRIVKQKTGLSVSKLILEIKLKYAFDMLMEKPDIRIQEVQHKIGFKSRSYFGQAFKDKFGFPPSHLNKKNT